MPKTQGREWLMTELAEHNTLFSDEVDGHTIEVNQSKVQPDYIWISVEAASFDDPQLAREYARLLLRAADALESAFL
jgi:hypothetical protein